MPRATPEASLDDLAGWIIDAADENEMWAVYRLLPWLDNAECMINAVLTALTGEFVEE